MKYKFFRIPALDPEAAEKELNAFCSSQSIIHVEKQFVPEGMNSYWSFCITFQDGWNSFTHKRGNKIDYREVLSEADFAVFVKLRLLRKDLAAGDGVPVYTVFTNEQLAEMVKKRIVTPTALKKIPGVGEARIKKYGDAYLALLKREFAGPARQPPAGEDDETDKD